MKFVNLRLSAAALAVRDLSVDLKVYTHDCVLPCICMQCMYSLWCSVLVFERVQFVVAHLLCVFRLVS